MPDDLGQHRPEGGSRMKNIMTIIRRKSREGTDYNLKPVPKVKAPRLTAAQLELFPIR